MNSNKVLIFLYGLLFLLLVITIVRFNRLKSAGIEDKDAENEIPATNILFESEVVGSYEKVKDLYGKKNILFFRYPQSSCSSCINSYLAEILAFQEEIGKDKIWIFPAFPDDRGSRIQLSNELAKCNYMNIPADSLLIPIYEGEQKSYFAWIDNEGEIDMVFFPEKDKLHLIREYFLEVKKKISAQASNRSD